MQNERLFQKDEIPNLEIIMASGFRIHSLMFEGVVGWAFFFKQLIF